jgi:hypothetical protein
MKLKITLWLLAILSCSALGLWQKDNLSIFCREYYSYWHDYEYHEDGFVQKKLLISPKIAKSDPEVAAIAESVINWYGNAEPLVSIAQYLDKFPQNEKFLSDFVFWLPEEKALDPQIQLLATKELLRINPENGIYHYLLADSLLANRSENDINSVFNAIEQGNRCADFNMPYDKYKQRVIDLAEKALPGHMIARIINYIGPGPNTDNLRKLPLVFANAAFTDGDSNLGSEICETIHRMQRKWFLSGDTRELSLRNMNWSFMPMRFGNWIYPEALELQRTNISKQRAKEIRLRLCAWIPEVLLLNAGQRVHTKTEPEIKEECKANWALLANLLSPYFGRMFLSFVLTLFVFASLCLFFGYTKNEKVGFFKILLFAFACFCFFIVVGRFFSLLFFEEFWHEISHFAEMPSQRMGLSAIFEGLPVSTLFLAVPLAGLIILLLTKFSVTVKKRWYVRWSKKLLFCVVLSTVWIGLISILKLFCHRRFEPEELIFLFIIVFAASFIVSVFSRWLCRWKVFWLLPVAVLFGSFSVVAEGYFYLGYLIMILFIIFSALIIVVPASPAAFPARCLKLLSPFIVIYWLLFVALMPLSAYRINYEKNRAERSLPVKRIYTLPEPNEALYQRVLARFDSNEITCYGAFRFIGLIMPGDLPGILKKFYELPSDFDEYSHMSVIGSPRQSRRLIREPNDVNDAYLIRAVMCSGKDVTNILTEAMSDPNRDRALLERAKLGDVTAKQHLEALLAKRIEEGNDFPTSDVYAQWWQKPVFSYEIISSLACVSGPNEAAGRYTSYIQRRNMIDLFDDFDFFRSVNLLPSLQARIVIKAYLAKVKEWNSPSQQRWKEYPDMTLQPLRHLVGIYGDKEIAEEVFELMLQTAEQSSESLLLDVSPYFTIDSAGLLKKGLSSNNDKFRAWTVWQLRKVGHQFTQEEIDNLMRDASWMVRANATVAAPQLTKELAQKDKNPFVRFSASLNN